MSEYDDKSPPEEAVAPEQALDLVNVDEQSPVAAETAPDSDASARNLIYAVVAFCGIVTIASVGGMAVLGIRGSSDSTVTYEKLDDVVINAGKVDYGTESPPDGPNPCEGKKPDAPNVDCVIDAINNVLPQAGANVTKGYKGSMSVPYVPITTPYWQNKMCPVNVHWHLGAEHYSLGEYDETGTGPKFATVGLDRKLAISNVRGGFQCKYYDEKDNKFIRPFVWEHCVGMEVGETYEVHWPHCAAGACGTLDQYQTPFYDGVFCRDGILVDTSAQIGVQAQVFTIVNDEEYYYPDLIRGMIVDGEKGSDIAMYTGSTTGTSRNNEVCSQYSPITWQVDRKCHLISASSFDKMCADMKAQRDDMSDDLYAHGSRELVDDELAADNQANRVRRMRALKMQME